MSLKMPSKAQKAIIERQEGFQDAEDKSEHEVILEKSEQADSPAPPEVKEEPKADDVAPKALPSTKKKARKPKSVTPAPPEVSEPLIPQTFKIPQSLSEKIKIVSVTRKVKKEWPYTQQDIVSEALADWFKKVGE